MLEETTFSNHQVFSELEEKFSNLESYLKEKEESEDLGAAIQVRVHQLAICKVLTEIHNRPPSLLVQAHSNLAQSYLKLKYLDQALDHLSQALKYNSVHYNEGEVYKQTHIELLCLLGKVHLLKGNTNEAKELLTKAEIVNQSTNLRDDISFARIYWNIGKVHKFNKNYSESIKFYEKAWSIFKLHEENSPDLADLYLDLSNAYSKQGNSQETVDFLRRAINVLLNTQSYQVKAASLCLSLAKHLHKLDNFHEALEALRQAEHLQSESLGVYNKSTASTKRRICGVLLSAQEYQEALKECKSLEDIEAKIFGTKSLEFAKHLKVTGTILLILENFREAYSYLSKALPLYTKLGGSISVARDLKLKLRSIKKNIHSDSSNSQI